MAWADARARIKTVLEGVSITQGSDSPITQSLARVYEFPPETVQDLPCCVMNGATLISERRVSLRHKVYEEAIDLMLIDEGQTRAVELVEAYREAILDAFDADITLNGNASNIDGPQFGRPEGDGTVTSVSFTITVRLTESATFAP